MSQLQWVIQGNLGKRDHVEKMAKACKMRGLDCHLVKAIPFSDALPDVPDTCPTIFYGTTRFVNNAFLSGRWSPCAFFDETLFNYGQWRAHYGDRLLNAAAEITTMEAFAGSDHPSDETFFIRPLDDLKDFAGEVFTFQAFRQWTDKLKSGGYLFNVSIPIVVAKPVEIQFEWRLFMVGSRVSSGSLYRDHGDVTTRAHIPGDVHDFARETAEIWSPSPVFVLDIARTKRGLSVIEINGFNSSGFYGADIDQIIGDVSDWVIEQED